MLRQGYTLLNKDKSAAAAAHRQRTANSVGGRAGFYMQVVVVRAPRALRGILRLIFGIKKQENE